MAYRIRGARATCACGKKIFKNRKTARRVGKAAHPGTHLTAYQCTVNPEHWHYGHLPRELIAGEGTIDRGSAKVVTPTKTYYPKTPKRPRSGRYISFVPREDGSVLASVSAHLSVSISSETLPVVELLCPYCDSRLTARSWDFQCELCSSEIPVGDNMFVWSADREEREAALEIVENWLESTGMEDEEVGVIAPLLLKRFYELIDVLPSTPAQENARERAHRHRRVAELCFGHSGEL